MDDRIKKLAEELAKSYETAYNLCYPQVEYIINNNITDINIIEHTLDQVLDIYTEEGFYLFLKLLIYYRSINPENAKDYLELLIDFRPSEYIDFVKKIGKKQK